MKAKSAIFVLATLIWVLTVGCSTAEPDAGHESVLVYKPVFIGHGGVDETPIKTGLTFIALTTMAVDIDMLPQRVDVEFDDMMTKSGVPVNFHIVGTFQVTNSVKLVQQFGADRDKDGNWGFWNRNLDQPLRTAVRDAVKQRDMQEMAISQSAADTVGIEVKNAVDQIVSSIGLPIKLTALNVGRVNPPDAIKNQRIATAEQEQRVITEQQRKLAEDQRKAAEEARASADNAYNEKMRLSPDQYVQLEQIKMLHDVCGKGACTFLLGDNGTTPVYNVRK